MRNLNRGEFRREIARPGKPARSEPCLECGGCLVIERTYAGLSISFDRSRVDCSSCLELYHLVAEMVDEHNAKAA